MASGCLDPPRDGEVRAGAHGRVDAVAVEAATLASRDGRAVAPRRRPGRSTASRRGRRPSPSCASTPRSARPSAARFPPSSPPTASRPSSAPTPTCSTRASPVCSTAFTGRTPTSAATSPSTPPTSPPTRTVNDRRAREADQRHVAVTQVHPRRVELIPDVDTARAGADLVVRPVHDVVGEELGAAVEELGERLLPVLGVELVLLFHRDPRDLASLLRHLAAQLGVLCLELG